MGMAQDIYEVLHEVHTMKPRFHQCNDEIIFISRNLKVEVFPHFPRTANVKKSRDYGLAVRFAVCGLRL